MAPTVFGTADRIGALSVTETVYKVQSKLNKIYYNSNPTM